MAMEGRPLLPTKQPRIVNGERAVPSDRPFFARAGYDSYFFTNEVLCGATLIWPDIAISAAHCQGAFNHGLQILDESTGDYTKLVPINQQVRHPGWSTNRQNLNYDILVMRLTTPLKSTDAAKTIPINTNSNSPRNNQQLKALGYGVTETGVVSDFLREADVTYISNDECFGRGIKFNNVLKSQEVMCTDPFGGRTATCLGDSGGPLTDATGTTLIGVISFGSGCEADLIPDGHARMSEVSDWVQKQICLLSANPPFTCQTSSTNNDRDPEAVEVVVDFSHDFYPEHTTFAVTSKKSPDALYAGPQYIPTRSGRHQESVFLAPGEYIFEVYDSRGNGLVSDRGNGSWKISALYDGCTETQIASGTAEFTNEQATQFVVDNRKPTGNCGGTVITIANAGEESNEDVVNVSNLLSEEMETCLLQKKIESSLGASFSTTCECAPSDGSGTIELACFREDGSSCASHNESCSSSGDCCSGRKCSAGRCRSSASSATSTGRDSNRLGGTVVGGAAGRQGRTSGKNLRGR